MEESISIPATFAMVPVARRGVAALLAGAACVADAELVAGELLVDAVRHSFGTVIVRVSWTDVVRIEVKDQRRYHPRPELLPTDRNAPDPIAVVSLVAQEMGSSGTRGTFCSTWAVLYDAARVDDAGNTNEEDEKSDPPAWEDPTS